MSYGLESSAVFCKVRNGFLKKIVYHSDPFTDAGSMLIGVVLPALMVMTGEVIGLMVREPSMTTILYWVCSFAALGIFDLLV